MEPLTLIMPCGGRSTRFNMQKPKWMLTHPNGNLMLIETISGLNTKNISRIIIILIKEHIENNKLNLDKVSNKIYEITNIVPDFLILDDFTKSQSETVSKGILAKSITGPIFIKDCDNYFNVNPISGNYVCISELEKDTNAINKGYVSLDKFGKLLGIVEKTVINNKFCAGGYAFEDAKYFVEIFNKLEKLKCINQEEIYISHIIQQMLLENISFDVKNIEKYKDWGTIENWEKYFRSYKTLFIDLDGTLVKNSSEYFDNIWGETDGLKNNIEIINKLYDTNRCTIIITTSRKDTYKQKTIDQLNKLNIKYHNILFNLPHAQRIIINDYSNSNPYPSVLALNLKRDEDNLKELLLWI